MFAGSPAVYAAPRAPDAQLRPDSLHAEGSWDSGHEFRDLCFTQLELLLHDILRQPRWQATVFARVPQSFSSGQLELQRIASAGASTVERREGKLLLGSGTATEEALINAEVMGLKLRCTCDIGWPNKMHAYPHGVVCRLSLCLRVESSCPWLMKSFW